MPFPPERQVASLAEARAQRTREQAPLFWDQGGRLMPALSITRLAEYRRASETLEDSRRRAASSLPRGAGTPFSRASSFPAKSASASWLSAILAELDALKEQAAPNAFEAALAVADLCAQAGTPEPVADTDENGNVELFIRRDSSAILLVISNETLQVFGNRDGERSRGRFEFTGRLWRTLLPIFLDTILAEEDQKVKSRA